MAWEASPCLSVSAMPADGAPEEGSWGRCCAGTGCQHFAAPS